MTGSVKTTGKNFEGITLSVKTASKNFGTEDLKHLNG